MQAATNGKLAEALRERREFIGKIIRKLETLGEAEQSQNNAALTSQPSIEQILAEISTFADVLKWARKNFEPSDVLLLETKFMKKLQLHPAREQDANYCRLLTLIFYLLAVNQASKVYGDFSHRAISEAFATHLDMYHTLHLLEIVCYFANITIQVYILKSIVAEVLAFHQDYPLTEQQDIALAWLCLLPEEGIPLDDGTPLVDLYFSPEIEADIKVGLKMTEAPKRENLSSIQEAVNDLQKGTPTLAQRYNLTVDDALIGQRNKIRAPYYSPDLNLCLRLRNLITLADMKRAASSALLDKLTQLWEILLPLHIDIGEMSDFK